MNDNWSQTEYEAYRAMEAAQAGQDVGIILKNLGYYHQGVVDTACAAAGKKCKKSLDGKKTRGKLYPK